MTSISKEYRERLFEDVKVGGPEDCWLWLGTLDNKAYGKISIEGDIWFVHRVVYTIYNGEIGEHTINHHCDIPNCVNPNHLYKGDRSDNVQDMWDRGRRDKEEMRGENAPTSKITDDEAKEIKERIEAGDETYAEIAEDYPITESTIGSIAVGDVWNYD